MRYEKHDLINHSDVIMSAMASLITGVSIVSLIVCSGADQRNHQRSASLAFVRGIHRWPVESFHQGPVMREMLPFDDVIMFYSAAMCNPSCGWVIVASHYRMQEPQHDFGFDLANLWFYIRYIYATSFIVVVGTNLLGWSPCVIVSARSHTCRSMIAYTQIWNVQTNSCIAVTNHLYVII